MGEAPVLVGSLSTVRTSSSAMGGPVRLKSGAAVVVGALMARGRVRKAASTSWRVSPETKTSLYGWFGLCGVVWGFGVGTCGCLLSGFLFMGAHKTRDRFFHRSVCLFPIYSMHMQNVHSSPTLPTWWWARPAWARLFARRGARPTASAPPAATPVVHVINSDRVNKSSRHPQNTKSTIPRTWNASTLCCTAPAPAVVLTASVTNPSPTARPPSRRASI